MARLSSERLRLHITNVITWTMDESDQPIYENFNIKLTVNGRETVPFVNRSYELCDGNIQGLISIINDSLNGEKYTEFEFTEPDFNFEIKRYETREHSIFKEITLPESYEFIVWVNSGNWNGIYSATEIGHKLFVERDDLIKFRDGLQQEWDNRMILPYNGQEIYDMIKNGELDDLLMNNEYKDAVEKVELGQRKSFEIENVEDLMKKMKN